MKKVRINSASADDTLKLATEIGQRLKGGEAIGLVSDLGGGKTTFVRGLARGLGSQDMVHSPSFTLANEYRTADITLNHFDFYRLKEPGVMRNELAEALADKQTVVAVEWGGIVEDVLPKERLTINFQATSDTDRELTLTYPEQLGYLIKNT